MTAVTNGFRPHYTACCILKWKSTQAVQNITSFGGTQSESPEHHVLGQHSIGQSKISHPSAALRQSRTSCPWTALNWSVQNIASFGCTQTVQNITSLGGTQSVSPEHNVLRQALNQRVQNIISLGGTQSVSPEHHVVRRHSIGQYRTSRPWVTLTVSPDYTVFGRYN
jgi:hypothetical protein